MDARTGRSPVSPLGVLAAASLVLVGIVALALWRGSAGAASAPELGWAKAPEVARPVEAFALQSDLPQVPAGPGTAGHPGHFPGQAIIDDVVVRPAGGLVAVGYVGPDWQPIAWRSGDASSGTLSEMDEAGGTLALSLAVGPDGRLVAGGYRRDAATVWTSADGASWARGTLPTIDPPGSWTRITAIARSDGGWLAGGSVGPELFDRTARFWRSDDGMTWMTGGDAPAFAGAEVTAIVQTDDGAWLAFGRLGTGQRTTGSVAWRSTDGGTTWTRIDDPGLARGFGRAAAVGSDGAIVAVGSEPDEIGAYSWRSDDDGRTWTQAPETPELTFFGRKIRMMAIAAGPTGYVAVGNLVSLQFGTGMAWTSPDGLTWRRTPNIPDFGQGEPLAVVRDDDRYVAAGSFGAPDNYIPRVGLSPPAR